jgi:predicted transcriptional regulator
VSFLTVLEEVTGKIAPGRTASFTEAHVIKALETIDTRKIVGRQKLAEELELGMGTTRTLIDHLKRQMLIKVSRRGITLSQSGQELLSNLRAHLSKGVEIPPSPLTIGAHNIAVLIRNIGDKVKSGVEQRDEAIKMGATGATTLVFSQNELSMPGVKEEIFKHAPHVRHTLMSKLKPEENDVIIIGSAQRKQTAEFGAVMSALSLLKR